MNPDQIASSNSESAHQKALFAWANMAVLHGTYVACQMEAYTNVVARGNHEYGEHTLSNVKLPELALMHHIPNGGQRTGKYGAAAAGAKMKAEGVKAGVPDIFLPVPVIGNVWAGQVDHTGKVHHIQVRGIISCGLYLEMKKPTEIKNTSKEQDAFLQAVHNVSYTVAIADHWRTAARAILRYIGAPHDIPAPETANLIYHAQQPAQAGS